MDSGHGRVFYSASSKKVSLMGKLGKYEEYSLFSASCAHLILLCTVVERGSENQNVLILLFLNLDNDQCGFRWENSTGKNNLFLPLGWHYHRVLIIVECK